MSGVGFNAGTLNTITSCISHVESNLNRGTLSASSKPTSTEVQSWIIRAKQELMDTYGFTWSRVYAYMTTTAGEYRYALPLDFAEGGYVIRDTTAGERITPIDPVSFDSLFPDVADEASGSPTYYTIKDRELWLSAPASGETRLELEYLRSGDDSTTTDVSYIPELMRFRMCDYATYRAFVALEMWQNAQVYKAEWEYSLGKSNKRDKKKRWSALGYKVRGFIV
jgi:hypothetical protein